MKKVWKLVCSLFLSLGLVACANNASTQNEEPAQEIVPNYEAVIEIQDYGTIKCKLLGSAAPISVKNFVKLCDDHFYDGNSFHRIIEGFVIQGGMDHEDKYESIYGEFSSNGFENSIPHKRGAIAMARAGDPNSASTQFYICHKDCDSLDGNYATFGYVTEGLDVVDAIATKVGPKATDNNGTIEEKDQPIITSIRCTMIKE